MTQPGSFSCPSCGDEFTTREQLDDHNSHQHRSVPRGRTPAGDPDGGDAEETP